jgi:LuxR family maltose regulon positive regulatory protein
MDLGLIALALEPILFEASLQYERGGKSVGLRHLNDAITLAHTHGFFITLIRRKAQIKIMLQDLLSVRRISNPMRQFIKKLLVAMSKTSKAHENFRKDAPTARAVSLELFTDRELEVLKLLECGLSRAEIAETLNISLNTTKSHLSHIFTKLGVTSKLDAFRALEQICLPSGPARQEDG